MSTTATLAERAMRGVIGGAGGAGGAGGGSTAGGGRTAAGDSVDLNATRSPTDTCLYRYLTLPNGMRVLLVQDTSCSLELHESASGAAASTSATEAEADPAAYEAQDSTSVAADATRPAVVVNLDTADLRRREDRQARTETKGADAGASGKAAEPRAGRRPGRRSNRSRPSGSAPGAGADAPDGQDDGVVTDSSSSASFGDGRDSPVGVPIGRSPNRMVRARVVGRPAVHESQGSSQSLSGSESISDSDSADSESIEEPDLAAKPAHTRPAPAAAAKKSAQKPTRAAAALTVSVGSFVDPPLVQGAAHFLEHLLFMGSEKYPAEAEYDQFLTTHGGSSNAHTETEATCFYFDVQPAFLEGALDRMAQCVFAPKWKADAMDRELKAVDSEFQQSLLDDPIRIERLRGTDAKAGHPVGVFPWGNVRSLKTIPEQAGIDVKAAVLDLYNRYYSANLCSLVVRGVHTLDALEAMVMRCFAGFPSKNYPRIDFESSGMPYEPSSLPRLVKVAAIRNTYGFGMSWCLPPLWRMYKTRPDDYISHCLGHESKGSVFSVLQARGLATALSAGCDPSSSVSNTACDMFSVNITLTDAGLSRWQEVGLLVFQYIQLMLRTGPQRWIFDEQKQLADTAYRFAEVSDPLDHVLDLGAVIDTGIVAPQDILTAGRSLMEWDPDTITKLLALMTPSSVRVELLARQFEAEANQTEEWFGTKYSAGPLPESVVQLWSNPPECPDLLMPLPNPFLPTQLAIRADLVALAEAGDVPVVGAGTTRVLSTTLPTDPRLIVPSVIYNSAHGKCWHKMDRTFHVPRGYSWFRLYCPIIEVSPTNMILANLYAQIVVQELADVAYQASLAQINYGLNSWNHGLEIGFSGLTDKYLQFAEQVMQYIVSCKFSRNTFDVARERLLQTLENSMLSPASHAGHEWNCIMLANCVDISESVATIKSCTLESFQGFLTHLFASVFTEALIVGNFIESEALELMHMVVGAVAGPAAISSPLHSDSKVAEVELPIDPVMRLPSGQCLVRQLKAKQPDEVNSVVHNYYQLGRDGVDMRAGVGLLSHVLYEPVFDCLRTKMQLGYSVEVGIRNTSGILGIAIIVQSSTTSVTVVNQRIEQFLVAMREELVKMSQEEFDKHVSSVVDQYLQKDLSLYEEASRHWNDLDKRRFAFNSVLDVAAFLKTFQKEQLLAVFDAAFAPSRRKKVSCRVVAPGTGPGVAPRKTADDDSDDDSDSGSDDDSDSGSESGSSDDDENESESVAARALRVELPPELEISVTDVEQLHKTAVYYPRP